MKSSEFIVFESEEIVGEDWEDIKNKASQIGGAVANKAKDVWNGYSKDAKIGMKQQKAAIKQARIQALQAWGQQAQAIAQSGKQVSTQQVKSWWDNSKFAKGTPSVGAPTNVSNTGIAEWITKQIADQARRGALGSPAPANAPQQQAPARNNVAQLPRRNSQPQAVQTADQMFNQFESLPEQEQQKFIQIMQQQGGLGQAPKPSTAGGNV